MTMQTTNKLLLLFMYNPLVLCQEGIWQICGPTASSVSSTNRVLFKGQRAVQLSLVRSAQYWVVGLIPFNIERIKYNQRVHTVRSRLCGHAFSSAVYYHLS